MKLQVSVRNRFLNSLSLPEAARLAPFLKPISLDQGVILNEPGDEIENIVFPHSGMVSLLAIMNNGSAVETATIGREGVVGGMAGLGLHTSLTRAVVQTPLVASQIAAGRLRKAVEASDELRNVIVHCNDALLGQVQITAACNALHPIQARLARWILQTKDRTDGEKLPLTQQLLSEMLGVRRSSVSEVAAQLQSAGLIRYTRGSIQIIDEDGLKRTACECYETIKAQAERLLR